jgi:hypothetical protein
VCIDKILSNPSLIFKAMSNASRSILIGGLALALGGLAAKAQNFTYSSFDSDVDGWNCGGWSDNGATYTATWDGSLDFASNTLSGSLRLDVTFPTTGNGAAHFQSCRTMADFTPYNAVAIEVYVAPGSLPSPSSDYGTLDLRLRTGDWNSSWPGVVINFGAITNTGWTHIQAPIPATTSTNFVGANLEWAATYTNAATIWVDQIVFLLPEKILAFSTWDSGISGWDCNGWNDAGVSTAVFWDALHDADNKVSSGSLRVDAIFTNSATVHLQTCQGLADFSSYKKVSLQVYVDPSSPLSPAGNYGIFDVRLRTGNWDWPGVVVSLGTVTNTGWTKLEGAIPATTSTNFAGINLEWSANYADPNQTIQIWFDNLLFIGEAKPVPPPALAISKSEPGLEIVTSGNGDYSRKNVATVASLAPMLPWINYTNPVTYSMTLNENVEPGSSDGANTYVINIMLSGTSAATINASPDWNEPNGLFMEAGVATNGVVYAAVEYKTNAPNSHGIRFTPQGLVLQTNTHLTSLVGTWALTVSSNLVTLTTPGGLTAQGSLPEDVPALFSPNLFALFGAQPNTFKDRKISLSRVHIYGGADFSGTVDQDFTTSTNLNANILELQEEDPGGIHLKPTNTVWRVSWTIPDVGFNLFGSPALTGSPWTQMSLTPIPVGAYRADYIISTDVADPRYFFRLQK